MVLLDIFRLRLAPLFAQQPVEKVLNRDAMANPGCLDWYVNFARERANS